MAIEPIRRKVRRTVTRAINAASAADAVGKITRGCEIYGVSKGQFSLIELIEHVLDATGPASVVISTWTAAGADLAHAQGLLSDGRILGMRWLVDYSFPSRQPGYCRLLRDRFGDNSIACCANHAKFVLVHNEQWSVAIRTSMNLNLNRRLESYEISDDPKMVAWLLEVVEMTFRDGKTIGDAASAPGAAKAATSSIGGQVERAPQMSFEVDHGDKRIGFD